MWPVRDLGAQKTRCVNTRPGVLGHGETLEAIERTGAGKQQRPQIHDVPSREQLLRRLLQQSKQMAPQGTSAPWLTLAGFHQGSHYLEEMWSQYVCPVDSVGFFCVLLSCSLLVKATWMGWDRTVGQQNLAKRATVHIVSENWAKEAGFVRPGLWGIQLVCGGSKLVWATAREGWQERGGCGFWGIQCHDADTLVNCLISGVYQTVSIRGQT